MSRPQHCNCVGRQGVTAPGGIRAPSLSFGSAAKIGPEVTFGANDLETVSHRYFLTAEEWMVFSQALEPFLPQHCLRQHIKIG